MKRRLLAWLLLGTACLWLLFSYLPPETIPWQITIGPRWLPLLRVLVVGGGVVFIVIQIILVLAVLKFPSQVDATVGEEETPIRIRRGWELWWTTIPLLVSLVLFIVSYCMLAG